MNNLSNNEAIMQQKAVQYFAPQSEEDMPITPDEDTNFRYYTLEKLFKFYYPDSSNSIGKDSSKEERNKKQINDSSFTYGEIVKF